MKAHSIFLGIAAATTVASAFADGTHFSIPSNTVVPVVFRDELNLKENRAGDRFLTTVRDDRDFPKGTRIEGRIIDIKPRRDDRPAFMDLEFTRVIFPDGTKTPINAVPIKLDLKGVSRNPDGRYTANRKIVNNDNMVAGGALGGLVIGALIKKPFEGAFLGTLIGIVASEANKNQESDVVIRRGDVMGALIERDFNADSRDSYGRYDDRDRDRGHHANDTDLRISFNDRDLRFSNDTPPYRLDDTIMVPLDQAADQMNLKVERLSNGVVLLEADDSMLKLEMNSKDYRINGRRGSFDREVVNKEGVIYVPIKALSLMDLGRISINGTKVED